MPAIHAGLVVKGAQHRNDQVIVDHQALADLRSGNLVLATDPPVLSTLGVAVLERWEDLPGSWEFELPLAVALLQEALLARDVEYLAMLAFWWDVRQKFDESSLLADGEVLRLLPYLNRTVAGFNPWVALRESSTTLELPVPWDDLEAAAPAPAAKTSAALRKLRSRLDPGRMKSVQIFCTAMTVLFLRGANSSATGPFLDDLKLPHKTERHAAATSTNH